MAMGKSFSVGGKIRVCLVPSKNAAAETTAFCLRQDAAKTNTTGTPGARSVCASLFAVFTLSLCYLVNDSVH